MSRELARTPPPQERAVNTSQYKSPSAHLREEITQGNVTVLNFEVTEFVGNGNQGSASVAELIYERNGRLESLNCVVKQASLDEQFFRKERKILNQVTREQSSSVETGVASFIYKENDSYKNTGFLFMAKGEFSLRFCIPHIQKLKTTNPALHQILIIDFFQSMIKMLNTFSKEKIVHADIKPENLVYRNTKNPNYSGWIAIDFGLTQKANQAHSRVVGTPAFLAHEVLFEKYYSAAADIYAFGLILNEFLGVTNKCIYSTDGRRFYDEMKANYERDLHLSPVPQETVVNVGEADFYAYIQKIIAAMISPNRHCRVATETLPIICENLKQLAINWYPLYAFQFYDTLKSSIANNKTHEPAFKVKRISSSSLFDSDEQRKRSSSSNTSNSSDGNNSTNYAHPAHACIIS